MAALTTFRLRGIIPSEGELSDMGRRRYQQPNIFKTRAKRPQWYFRARVDALRGSDGEKHIDRPETRHYLGFCDELGKQEAKKLRDGMLSELINKPQVLIPSQIRFGEVLKAYRRDHLAALRPTTRSTQENAIAKHFDGPLGKLRMCDIDVQTIQRWILSMDLAYRTRKDYFRLLRLIWNKAEEWGYATRSFPKARFTFGVERECKGREMPTMDQLRRLLAALEDPYRAMAEVALYSGLRIGEIRGLKWEDLSATSVTVRRRISKQGDVDVPKTKRGFRVLDIRPLAGVFSRLPRESEWIFADGPTSYAWLATQMQRAREVAGITVARFSWHHLRAAFNTLARVEGADSVDRQAMLGHADEATNAVYVHQSPDDLRRRGDLMMAVQSAILGETKGVQ